MKLTFAINFFSQKSKWSKNCSTKVLKLTKQEIQQILNQRIFIAQKYQKKHESNLTI